MLSSRTSLVLWLSCAQVPRFVLDYVIPVDYPKQLERWLSDGENDEGASAECAHHLAECRKLHPHMQSLEDWLREQGVADLPGEDELAQQSWRLARRGVVVASLSLPAALMSALTPSSRGPPAPSFLLASREPHGK